MYKLQIMLLCFNLLLCTYVIIYVYFDSVLKILPTNLEVCHKHFNTLFLQNIDKKIHYFRSNFYTDLRVLILY